MVLALVLIPMTGWAFMMNTSGSTPPTIEKIEPFVNVIEVEKTYESEVIRLATKYGQDETLVRKIIFCESTVYAHATGTKAVVGIDVGYFQINTYFHEATAKKMGLDIYKWEDNLEYGFWLMSREGTQPWSASKFCWSK